MKALIVDNIILYKCNNFYYAPLIYNNSFFERYFQVFSKLKVVAKVFEAREDDVVNLIKLDTTLIDIVELPPYRGLKQMFRVLPRIIKIFYGIDYDCVCSIMKVVQLESIFAVLFGHLKRPYAVEVVNDPQSITEGFSIVKLVSLFFMRYFMRHAIGVSYITKNILEEKYPCYGMTDTGRRKGYFYTDYPTLDLILDNDISARKYPVNLQSIKLLHVANVIENDAKGQTTVLKATKIVCDNGIDAKVTFLGDGSYVEYLKKLAKELGILDKVYFAGRISDHEKVMDYFRNSDLFIFPSRSEGQGRVNLEAQSVGLPCLASNVGGIVELFDSSYLFAPDDAEGFGNKIISLCKNPKELEMMSKDNLKNVNYFAFPSVKEKRTEFYHKLLVSSEKKKAE